MTNTAPPVFYKFYPIEPWLPNLLSGNSMLFSERNSFNDPFDSRPAFRISKNKDSARKFMNNGFPKKSLPPAKRLIKINQFIEMKKVPTSTGNGPIDALLDSIGILCLTPNWDNQLLWAHYGAHHNGICIGFKSDIDFFRTAQQVSYQEKLPIIVRPDDDPNSVLEKALLTKSKCWEYEEEWRILKNTTSQFERDTTFYQDKELQRLAIDCSGPGIYKFKNDAIHSITIGIRTHPNQVKLVIDAVKKFNPAVPIYRAIQSQTEYKITRHEIIK